MACRRERAGWGLRRAQPVDDLGRNHGDTGVPQEGTGHPQGGVPNPRWDVGVSRRLEDATWAWPSRLPRFVVEKGGARVGSRSPRRRRGECDPVPSAQAHAHADEADDAAGSRCGTGRSTWSTSAVLLGASANVERLGGIPIRAWRDDLTRDPGLAELRPGHPRRRRGDPLARPGVRESTERPAVVDELPSILAVGPSCGRNGRRASMTEGARSGVRRGPLRPHRSPAGGSTGRWPGWTCPPRPPRPRPGAGRGAARPADRAPGGRRSPAPADQGRHLPRATRTRRLPPATSPPERRAREPPTAGFARRPPAVS